MGLLALICSICDMYDPAVCILIDLPLRNLPLGSLGIHYPDRFVFCPLAPKAVRIFLHFGGYILLQPERQIKIFHFGQLRQVVIKSNMGLTCTDASDMIK